MKKIIFCAALLTSLSLNAQDLSTIYQNASFGAKGGISVADYIARPSHQVDPRAFIFLGGYAEYELKEGIIFRPEMILSFIGGRQHTFRANSVNPEYLSNEKLTYLYFPLNIKHNVGKVGLMGGPQLGFRLSANYNYQIVDNGTVTYEIDENISEHRRFLDFGIGLGADYQVTETIKAELGYYYGLSTINNTTTTVKLHNSIIRLGISYMIQQP